MKSDSFSSLSAEKRVFPPPASFSENAEISSLAQYQKMRAEAERDFDGFWKRLGTTELQWAKSFTKTYEWNAPDAKWFVGGRLNASVQCLDRHQKTPRWSKTALLWEGEPGEVRKLTYEELHRMTCQAAHALTNLGVKSGDIVTIYMPLIPEVVAAMLACARLGAAHSVVFGGFSASALTDRINDSKSKIVITADAGFRRGQAVPLKATVDEALKACPSVEKVLCVKRAGIDVNWVQGRDIWWEAALKNAETDFPPPAFDSEHLLFTLYTSGTTGKPKGIMHTTAGYLLWCKLTTRWVFDLKDSDVYWCTADVGWVTGHSYLVYGPLQNGATVMMYEGAPQFPDWGRMWKIIQAHKVSIFYTAPTAIRALMGQGDEIPKKYDLSSLRLLGSVGEPINPEAWMWFNKNIGHDKCPIVDTWWQTETGGILVSPVPGAVPTKPGSCTLPLPGIFPDVVTRDGKSCGPNEGGYLILRKPWPAMLRGIFGDKERFQKTYFSDFKDIYFTGDGARRDEDGYLWVMGRVDDVINVSGHRLGTAEVESALVSHPTVNEAAVVGRPDPIKGQGIVAFVTLQADSRLQDQDPRTETLVKGLKDHVAKEIGGLARPDEIKIVSALPKTRSGKIMRRLLREIAAGGKATGDTTTLEDVHVLEKLMQSGSSGDEE
ncbi:MAG: acetate--CoA ligase [Bdellovibrionales bacterium]|nr:acetate--CoA ligase [Bdellovibrionales bacterium]